MRLKALELQGFKSFPDKTVLQFDASITAVVGPNGSGKSNLSDAIRWVMGEQSSRALRGGKMEDVIFGGTQQRKSNGFAEVSLTLDNEDGQLSIGESELTVTRRYYRSGDSEYYINRRLVRLRDLHELFMDTGLGQEGYSLVGQGKIDEILSVKSSQRREIFEEAAGISRYRHRKEEAERKLAHTRENLQRMTDKLDELELQLHPLREQADKAGQYFRAQEELRSLEVSLWMQRLAALRVQHDTVRNAFQETEERLRMTQKESTRFYELSESLLQETHKKELELETTRQEESRLDEESAIITQRISVLQVQIENNGQQHQKLLQESEAQHNRADDLSIKLREKEAQIVQLAQEIRQAQTALTSMVTEQQETEATLESARGTLAHLHEQAQQELLSRQRVESLLSMLDATALELTARETNLTSELEERTGLLSEALKEVSSSEQTKAALTKQLEGNTQSLLQEKATLDTVLAEEQCKHERWIALRMEENVLFSRLHMLEDMERHYEGYSKSVKTIMEQSDKGYLQGVHGPLASLLEVSEDYAVAIEVALGGAMQNVVVDTQAHGKAVLGDLKRRDAGRVTCLPLDAIHANRLDSKAFQSQPGYLGLAAEHVRYATAYESIVCQLLGKVLLVSDLDSGIAMARKQQHRYRIVTRDGQVLSPGGAMTGGSVNRRGGLMTRATELATLRDKQEVLRQERIKAEEHLEEAKAHRQHLESQLEKTQGTQKDIEQQSQELATRLQAQQFRAQDLLRQTEQLNLELSAVRMKAGEQTGQAAQAREKLARFDLRSTDLARECFEAEERVQQRQAARERLLEGHREERMKLAVLAAEQKALETAMAEQKRQGETLSQDSGKCALELLQLETETAQMQKTVKEQEHNWASVQLRKDSLRIRLLELAKEKLELEAHRGQAERDSRAQNDQLLHAQRECVLLEQKKLAGEQEETQLLEKLWEQYELSHEAARKIMQPIDDAATAERRIATLRGEIRALGHVNLGAIEDYARVHERYDYLQEQKRDVEESDHQLVGIIGELLGQMKTIFRREFTRINEAFGQTFRELFGGGSATLSLEDERDILSCGIEIEVQPPGKSLKHLNLLSGGEKAFVAIALYFAIIKIRPTPFCVMDEIEAALDDANVLRFARYLRSMVQNTQFIVITHRRGTMEEADVLYGVTMQSQGISRILRLNLTETELGQF